MNIVAIIYGGFHAGIDRGTRTGVWWLSYAELWIVVNVLLIVVQLQLRKEHFSQQTTHNIVLTLYFLPNNLHDPLLDNHYIFP